MFFLVRFQFWNTLLKGLNKYFSASNSSIWNSIEFVWKKWTYAAASMELHYHNIKNTRVGSNLTLFKSGRFFLIFRFAMIWKLEVTNSSTEGTKSKMLLLHSFPTSFKWFRAPPTYIVLQFFESKFFLFFIV